MAPTAKKTASPEGRARKAALLARLKGWAGATHPFPLAIVVALTALVGFASADGEPDGARMALLLTAMALSQAAIGWSNDYVDRERDRLSQPWKPVAAGLVQARHLPPAIGVALVGSGVAGASLGAWPLALLAAGTAAGFAYNFGVKDTPLSAAPYVVALAALPLFVWSSLGVFREELLLLYPVAFPLAVAAHAANVLPDMEADRGSGRRGLAVALGRRGTLMLLGVCLVAPLASLAASSRFVEYGQATLLPSVAGYCGACAVAGFLYAFGRGRDAGVWAFRLLAMASAVFAAGWLASV